MLVQGTPTAGTCWHMFDGPDGQRGTLVDLNACSNSARRRTFSSTINPSFVVAMPRSMTRRPARCRPTSRFAFQSQRRASNALRRKKGRPR